ncbi:MAG: hypothetical protein IPL77_17400 [Flavobacteriales bacterium]|nr:hypothetical protein [Flavobacteriales bacterium]
MKAISIIMFLLMPFTAVLLLWIFYPRRFYWEHLIFSVHMHTIYFLFFILLMLIGLPFQGEWPAAVSRLVLACLWYLLLALRRVYGQDLGTTPPLRGDEHPLLRGLRRVDGDRNALGPFLLVTATHREALFSHPPSSGAPTQVAEW